MSLFKLPPCIEYHKLLKLYRRKKDQISAKCSWDTLQRLNGEKHIAKAWLWSESLFQNYSLMLSLFLDDSFVEPEAITASASDNAITHGNTSLGGKKVCCFFSSIRAFQRATNFKYKKIVKLVRASFSEGMSGKTTARFSKKHFFFFITMQLEKNQSRNS